MDREAVRAEVDREPFVPLRLYLTKNRTFDVPIKKAAHMVYGGVLVFKGMNELKHTVEGYDRLAFEQIETITAIPEPPKEAPKPIPMSKLKILDKTPAALGYTFPPEWHRP